MDAFQIIQPSAFLSPYVKHYWLMTINSEVQASERVIPTGMMCLMFHRGERIFSSSENRWQPRSFLSGQDTSYSNLSYRGTIDMISVGANPKDYLRIVRFQKALHCLQMQPHGSLAQLAYECGYYDQPHFIKEFKQFSGYTPTEYRTVCEPHSDFFS